MLSFIPIIFVVFIGYLTARYHILPEKSAEIFTRFTFFIAMPCQLFLAFSKTPINSILNFNYLFSFALTTLLIGSIIFIGSRFYAKQSLAESALNIMGTSQVNTAYFAIPFFILVFKNPTPVIPILLFQTLILTSILIMLIEYDRKNTNKHKAYLIQNMLLVPVKNPIILASILGFLFALFHISIFNTLFHCLNLIAITAAPLALISLGQSLHYDLKKVSKNELTEIIIISFVKLIIFPLTAYLIGYYLFALDHFWLISLIIMASMPTPKNMYIFAIQYQLNIKKSASVVAITTLFSFVTLNLLLMIWH